MQKVIALDIGSFSIKAIEIVKTFKSYEITKIYQNVIPQIDNVPTETIVPACMEQLFKENELVADRIVTAMPGQFISSRVLTFNFSDPRKINNTILSQIEEQVPFDMDQMIFDSHVLGTSSGKTNVLAVMTRKEFLKNFLELLQRINIDPKIVDVDSLSFFNLSPYLDIKAGESVAMVDIGHEKTSICVVLDGQLKLFRSINLGGRYITDFISRDFELPYSEAQREKHRIGRVLCAEDQADDLEGKDKLLAERMTLAAGAIVKELGRSVYAYKTIAGSNVSRFMISGGTSNIVNFDKFLQDHLEVPCEKLILNQTKLKISSELDPYMSIIPQGVAIGMRTVNSGSHQSQVNLRKGEFAYVQNYEAILSNVRRGLMLSSIAASLLLVSYGIQYYFYKVNHISKLQSIYAKQVVEQFPDTKKKATNIANFKKFQKDAEARFQKEIESRRKALSELTSEITSPGPLAPLRDLSANIKKENKIDLTLYKYEWKNAESADLTLQAETDSYENQSKIVESIRTISNLKDISDKDVKTKPGTNNQVIDFKIFAKYDTAAK